MVVTEKKGNIYHGDASYKQKEIVQLEWYETGKRILHKRTTSGTEVVCKFLNQSQQLTDGDILFEDDDSVIVVDIIPCSAMVIIVDDKYELASVCYEIGNKHLPLFYVNGELLVPFDLPLERLLTAQGYKVEMQQRKLLHPLRTTVAPHSDGSNGSLFSKIMKLTASQNI